MKRRQFLQHSSLIAGGVLLHDQLVAATLSKSDQPIRLGIIGCGDRGKGIMQVLQRIPEKFRIDAACDVLDLRIQETQKIAPQHKIQYSKEYRAVLDNPNIDAVIIATPLNAHFDIANAALQAGKHVYLEKTMTHTSAQALALVEQVKKSPTQVLQVGHQYRYTPLYFKVKQMINDGTLGKVTQIDCRWDRNWNWRRAVPKGYTDEQINWRMYREFSGGLPAELLSHQIDFVNWAFATHPDYIFASGGIDHYRDGRETFDNVQAICRYEKTGMIANFGATCAGEYEGYTFKIKGTRGTVSLLMNEGFFFPEKKAQQALGVVDGVAGATALQWKQGGGTPILNEPMEDGTWYALQEFHKSINENNLPASNVITGATTSFCVDMMNQSAFTQTIQRWQPAFDVSLESNKGDALSDGNRSLNDGKALNQGEPLNHGKPVNQEAPINRGRPINQGQPLNQGKPVNQETPLNRATPSS